MLRTVVNVVMTGARRWRCRVRCRRSRRCCWSIFAEGSRSRWSRYLQSRIAPAGGVGETSSESQLLRHLPNTPPSNKTVRKASVMPRRRRRWCCRGAHRAGLALAGLGKAGRLASPPVIIRHAELGCRFGRRLCFPAGRVLPVMLVRHAGRWRLMSARREREVAQQMKWRVLAAQGRSLSAEGNVAHRAEMLAESRYRAAERRSTTRLADARDSPAAADSPSGVRGGRRSLGTA